MKTLVLNPTSAYRPATMKPTLFAIASMALFAVNSLMAMNSEPPPALMENMHVPLGCVVSTEVYIKKLAANYPELKGRHLRMVKNGVEHTMALVTTQSGALFARDEYVGVLDLKATEDERLTDAQLAARALSMHDEISRRHPYTAVLGAETRSQMRQAAKRVGDMVNGARVYITADGAFTIWNGQGGVYVYVADRGTMTVEPHQGVSEEQLAQALAKNLKLGALKGEPRVTSTRSNNENASDSHRPSDARNGGIRSVRQPSESHGG